MLDPQAYNMPLDVAGGAGATEAGGGGARGPDAGGAGGGRSDAGAGAAAAAGAARRGQAHESDDAVCEMRGGARCTGARVHTWGLPSSCCTADSHILLASRRLAASSGLVITILVTSISHEHRGM